MNNKNQNINKSKPATADFVLDLFVETSALSILNIYRTEASDSQKSAIHNLYKNIDAFISRLAKIYQIKPANGKGQYISPFLDETFLTSEHEIRFALSWVLEKSENPKEILDKTFKNISSATNCCMFYSNTQCLVFDARPLDCRFYHMIGGSSQCKQCPKAMSAQRHEASMVFGRKLFAMLSKSGTNDSPEFFEYKTMGSIMYDISTEFGVYPLINGYLSKL